MERNSQRDLHQAFWQSSGGFDLVLGPVILSLGGLLLDRWIGTTPILMIVCLILGAVGASIKVYFDWKNGMAKAEADRDILLAEAAQLREQTRLQAERNSRESGAVS